MANHCYCTLKLSGPADELHRFKRQALAPAALYTLSLDSLRPAPPDMTTEERSEWREANWGPTGDAYRTHQSQEDNGNLNYEFATAWSPPNQSFMAHVAQQFTQLKLTLEYEEPMMGYEGRITAADGAVTSAENNRFDFNERYTPVNPG